MSELMEKILSLQLSVIIPAFNEEAAIESVVNNLDRILASSGATYEIIVVNDGSKDATGIAARKTKARVIDQPVNRGYGQAIMTGIASAKYNFIATIDADSSYTAEDLVKLMPHAEKNELVVGRRTGKEYRGRLLKYPARIVFRHLAEYVSGEAIPDINSGMRIFRKDVFTSLPAIHFCRGFSFSTTMTLMFLAGGFCTAFVPIEYRVRSGQSKIRYFRDTLRALQILFEIAVHYNPIKAILPVCAIPFIFALAFASSFLYTSSGVALVLALFSFYTSLVIFAIGMVLLQIRMSGKD